MDNTKNNDTSERLYSLLLRCSHGLSRGEHLREGMHPGQWRLLALLAQKGTVTQQELLDIVQIRPASLSELLSKLEYKGLITRTKDENDKRTVVVQITEHGKTIVEENVHYHRETADQLFSSLSEEERGQLTELLGKLVESWHLEYHGEGHWHHHEDMRRMRARHGGHDGFHGGYPR